MLRVLQMDPFSRRSFWQFLKKRKEGRTLILTTHMARASIVVFQMTLVVLRAQMDEADYLGDRIGLYHVVFQSHSCCFHSDHGQRHDSLLRLLAVPQASLCVLLQSQSQST